MSTQSLLTQNLPQNPKLLILVLFISLWTVAWKGWALWRAARRNDTGWFVAILILNTLGLLDIIYIFLISRRKFETLS